MIASSITWGRNMKSAQQKKTIEEYITDGETKVECLKCHHATMIAKIADIKSRLLRCPVCRTPVNDPETFRQMVCY